MTLHAANTSRLVDARSTQELETVRAERQGLQQLLHEITQYSDDGFVVTDANGNILEWSGEAERILGWTKHDVLGRQMILLPPGAGDSGEIGDLLHADTGSRPIRAELPAMHRDGHAVQVRLTLWSRRDRSGTALYALIRELGSPPAEPPVAYCDVGSIVESSDAAIVGEGLDGTIRTWNRAAVQLYGYAPEEVIGRPSTVVVPPERLEEADRLAEGARRGRHVHNRETVHLRKDRTRVDVAVTVSPIQGSDGVITGVSTIARDITEQRRMAAALEAALEEARQSDARSRRLVADVAHQIRNPLAGIRACAEVLLR
ncbi:MAG: PAS domain S-box protein, partial [Actinomycetota bacterium]|nr:PAS domain S-box protein [Actinomycetota bacterium]